jgi:predicted Zn-dependent protease with MMP-like domain
MQAFTMNRSKMKKEVARVLSQLPEEFNSRLHNVEIVIERRPGKRQLQTIGLDPKSDVLYGLYEGIPLSERSSFDPPLLPDRITIFSEPLARDFPDPIELRHQIRLTVLHEIAHFFGIDEEKIDKLGY